MRLDSSDVCYLSMPLFHSNAVYAGWSVALVRRGGDGARDLLGLALPATTSAATAPPT